MPEKKLKILRQSTFAILFSISSANAGVYNCTSSESQPVEITSKGQKFNFQRASAIFPEISRSSIQGIESKTPFLIYYAIDSSEAFMQYSVRFEIASLIESCRRDTNVQFAGLINSLYTKKNQFLLCKNKSLKYVNISTFPRLDKKLKSVRKYISKGDHTVDDILATYRTAHGLESNKAFSNYPLAHPDFLFELVNLIIKEEEFFPSKKFSPFLNLKSHGSRYNVLSGMHRCQEKAKGLSAEKALNALLTAKEKEFLKDQNSFEKVASNLEIYSRVLNKLGLGKNPSPIIAETKKDRILGDYNLGDYNMSSIVAGLGVDHGLGSDLSFGTGHPQLNWVLQDLFSNESDSTLGFMMLESCDTNRDAELFHSYLKNIYGYYSAKKSLWYRNLNWWEMLEAAQGSSTSLLEILKVKSAEIVNIELMN